MTTSSFTNLQRENIIAGMEENQFDLIVIGGGITGAGILLDAASRGIKTLLIEKDDFASGTSSKSTKLIHGGLRYLKQLDFWLVKEVGSERAIVHRLAPHLVIPEKMLLPLIEHGHYGKILTSIGLKIYDILADVNEDDQRQMLNKKETLELEPLLPEERLIGSGYYAEYRTDDARLTLENIKTALNYGATAINYVKATGFIYEYGKVAGVEVCDAISGKSFSIRSKYVINAAGPWVDEIRELNHSKKEKHLHLTKGIHLVFPKEKLPVKQSVYFDVADGRMIFAIPRGRTTYVGTTDTNYFDDKDDIAINGNDADYLINAVNEMFPKVHLKREDIISSWAGLRPLIHEEGKSASELSRKDEIFVSESDLISIAGGKLTGYRKMAERVVNKVSKRLNEFYHIDTGKCMTEQIPLCGGPWKDELEVNNYIRSVYDTIAADGFTEYYAWYLVTTFGKQTEDILRNYNDLDTVDAFERMIRAEFRYCAEKEMLMYPVDFFIRRTGRMYFDIESVTKFRDCIIKEYGVLFKVEPDTLNKLSKQLEDELLKHSHF